MEPSTRKPVGGGWFTFAGVMFVISGVANLLWGLAALANKRFRAGEAIAPGIEPIRGASWSYPGSGT